MSTLRAGIVAAEALGLDLLPVVGRDDGGLDEVRDGVVAVLGHLGQQAVVVHQDLRGRASRRPPCCSKAGLHPDAAADRRAMRSKLKKRSASALLVMPLLVRRAATR